MRVAALGAGVVAATLLPGGAPGVGVLLVALLIALAAWLGVGASGDLVAFGAAAVALAAVPAVMDARWLVEIDLAAACLLATAAVGGITLTAPLAPVLALRSVPAVTPRPGLHAVSALRGAALVGVVVVPFGALLLTADAAFAALAGGIPLPDGTSMPFRFVLFALVLTGSLGLGLAGEQPLAQPVRPKRALTPIEWILPLSALVVLFLAFVAVQVTVLFGGRDHVLQTTGLTYAEYARSGYWQLLAAAVLTLAVIAVALLLADAPLRRHRLILRALLASICTLTIVLLASALHRLDLYESAFGLTRLRITAEAFAWALAGLFTLVLVAGVLPIVRRNFARMTVGGAAIGLLAFSLSNPDARVARHNIERWERTGRLDISYLQTLSADAAPSIAKLPPGLRREALQPLASRLTSRDGWGSANLSRRRARQVLGSLQDGTAGDRG